MADKLLLKPAEAADAASVSKTTMYDLIARGEIQTVRVGTDLRVPVSALNKWITQLQKK